MRRDRKTWCNCTGRNRPKGIFFEVSNSGDLSLRGCHVAERSQNREKQHFGYSKLTAPLATVSKFVHSAICMY
jgi:hypothetical protein